MLVVVVPRELLGAVVVGPPDHRDGGRRRRDRGLHSPVPAPVADVIRAPGPRPSAPTSASPGPAITDLLPLRSRERPERPSAAERALGRHRRRRRERRRRRGSGSTALTPTRSATARGRSRGRHFARRDEFLVARILSRLRARAGRQSICANATVLDRSVRHRSR